MMRNMIRVALGNGPQAGGPATQVIARAAGEPADPTYTQRRALEPAAAEGAGMRTHMTCAPTVPEDSAWTKDGVDRVRPGDLGKLALEGRPCELGGWAEVRGRVAQYLDGVDVNMKVDAAGTSLHFDMVGPDSDIVEPESQACSRPGEARPDRLQTHGTRCSWRWLSFVMRAS